MSNNFDLTPMQTYIPPAYPTRASLDGRKLRTVPGRWAKNAAVIACIGTLSLGMLTGCTTPTEPPTRCDDALHGVVAADLPSAENGRDFDVEVRAHWGGSGAGPFYVAYLTEQEALGIIRNRLCEAGICFDSPVPDYVASVDGSHHAATARLSLFDARTRQGIVFPATWWDEFVWWDVGTHEEIQRALQADFTRRHTISAAFIQNPGESMCDEAWWSREGEPTFTEEEKQVAGQLLNERLEAQIDTFLDHLRTEGILR